MELPPISARNKDSKVSPLLNPTTRSPVGRSPSYSPAEFKNFIGGGRN